MQPKVLKPLRTKSNEKIELLCIFGFIEISKNLGKVSVINFSAFPKVKES